MDKFRIEATYIGPCTSGAGDRVTTEVNGNTFQHNLTNLRAYSTYSVVVIAINNAGETSGQEQQVATLPAGMQLLCIAYVATYFKSNSANIVID